MFRRFGLKWLSPSLNGRRFVHWCSIRSAEVYGVIVPLRGESCASFKGIQKTGKAFPSPCGVWIVSEVTRLRYDAFMLSSPYGVEIVSMPSVYEYATEWLPSPYGVFVVSRRLSFMMRLRNLRPLVEMDCCRGITMFTITKSFPSPCGVNVVSLLCCGYDKPL